MRRRISKDIGKSEIDSDDDLLMRLGIAIDFGIGMALQVSIVYMLGGISYGAQSSYKSPAGVLIYQK